MPVRAARPVPRPPWMHSFMEDLFDVFLSICVYFLGSLILWPIVIGLSIVFIPLTVLWRFLALTYSIPCTCGRSRLQCSCRQLASANEFSWIKHDDKLMTNTEYRAKLAHKKQLTKNTHEEREATISFPVESTDAADEAPTATTTNQQPETSAEEQKPLLEDTGFPPVTDDRMLRGNIHSLVLVVENTLNIGDMIAVIKERITELKLTSTGAKYFPRFTQCLVRTVGGSVAWVDDPAFFISKHVEILDKEVPDQTTLENLLQEKANEGLSVERPLWHLTIAKGYGKQKSVVLIWRFHGSVYDGVTIAKVLAYTLTNTKYITFKAHSQYYLFSSHVLRFLLIGPVRFLYLLIFNHSTRATAADTTPSADRSSPHLTDNYCWTERTLNLAVLLKNKMLLNMTFNDVLVGLFIGALKGHQPSNAVSRTTLNVDPSARLLIPFDMWVGHTKRQTLPQGNCITMLPLETTHIKEVIPRMWSAEYLFSNLKKMGDTRVQVYSLLWFYYLPLPHALFRYLSKRLHSGTYALVTSFNGPNMIDEIDGAAVQDIMYFTHPPVGVARSFNFISYSGTIKLSVLSQMDDLNSSSVDNMVRSMMTQLSVVNKMVFQRYFPDGVDENSCPYSQPQASRLYAEFLEKLKEIDKASTAVDEDSSPNTTHSGTSIGKCITTESIPSSKYTHCEVDGPTTSHARSQLLSNGSSTLFIKRPLGASQSPESTSIHEQGPGSSKQLTQRRDSPTQHIDPNLGLHVTSESVTWSSDFESISLSPTVDHTEIEIEQTVKPASKQNSPKLQIVSREGSTGPTRLSPTFTSTDEIAKSMEFVTPSGGNMSVAQAGRMTQERKDTDLTTLQVQRETDL